MVFIVIAVGAAGDMLVPASLGAALAGMLVIALGVSLHTYVPLRIAPLGVAACLAIALVADVWRREAPRQPTASAARGGERAHAGPANGRHRPVHTGRPSSPAACSCEPSIVTNRLIGSAA